MIVTRRDVHGAPAAGGRSAAGPSGRALGALALVAALAGCGGGSGGGTPSPPPDGTGDTGDTGGGDPDTTSPGTDGPGTAATLRPDQVSNADGDGSTTVVVEGYDESGLIRIQEYFTDGVPTRTSRLEYDAASRTESRVDFVGDTDEVSATTTYDYNADGAQSGRDMLDADGNLVARLSYDFAADGTVEAANLVRLAFEDGTPLPGGGQLVERTTYEYANGRLSRESIDTDADDTVDATRDYAYAEDGTLDTASYDDAVAGTTSVATWRYETGPCTLAWANSVYAHFCVAAE